MMFDALSYVEVRGNELQLTIGQKFDILQAALSNNLIDGLLEAEYLVSCLALYIYVG